MAITSSAKKVIRASAKKRVFNMRRKNALTSTTKTFMKAPSAANLAAAYKAIDKAAKTNVIHKNTAAHKKSRLARVLKGVSK
jgi:small subunit ribosomal protein S20